MTPFLADAADAAALLEPPGELAQPGFVERYAGDGRDGLAAPPRHLAADLHATAGLRRRRTVARLAQVTVASGPDEMSFAAGHGP